MAESNTMLCPEMQRNMCVFCVYGSWTLQRGIWSLPTPAICLPGCIAGGRLNGCPSRASRWACSWTLSMSRRNCALQPGEYIVFCGNGLVEARNAHGEMFGFGRVKCALEQEVEGGDELMDALDLRA